MSSELVTEDGDTVNGATGLEVGLKLLGSGTVVHLFIIKKSERKKKKKKEKTSEKTKKSNKMIINGLTFPTKTDLMSMSTKKESEEEKKKRRW